MSVQYGLLTKEHLNVLARQLRMPDGSVAFHLTCGSCSRLSRGWGDPYRHPVYRRCRGVPTAGDR